MKKVYLFFALIIILLIVAGCIVFFWPIIKTQNSQEVSLVPLEKPVEPPFIKNIKTATGVKVDLHYNGDYMPQNDWGWEQEQFYTSPGSDEKFLSVSKVKDRQNLDYGSTNYLSLFKSESSHSYQGTPIYITNPNDKYSLSYLGFKINDKSLISELTVALGIDYNAEYYNSSVRNDNNFSIASLLGIQTASACGPGLYLRKIGESTLDFVQESNGIMWYKLQKPIVLYNLSLQYSDQDCSAMPAYCKNQYGDPQECDKYFSCYYNATINDLAKGNLRMHVYYKANDKEGFLRIQMDNFIVSDQNGVYYQATMGEYFDHYYKAYLH